MYPAAVVQIPFAMFAWVGLVEWLICLWIIWLVDMQMLGYVQLTLAPITASFHLLYVIPCILLYHSEWSLRRKYLMMTDALQPARSSSRAGTSRQAATSSTSRQD